MVDQTKWGIDIVQQKNKQKAWETIIVKLQGHTLQLFQHYE